MNKIKIQTKCDHSTIIHEMLCESGTEAERLVVYNLDLLEEATRTALIHLGWTPPSQDKQPVEVSNNFKEEK